MKTHLAVALVSAALTVGIMRAFAPAPGPAGMVQLDNAKARVTSVTYQAGVPRERYVRPTDQIIVFLDESRYQRIDSKTGEKTIRQRKSGEAIWHDKGEDAPVLINMDKRPYRTLVIELK